jgi:hypothetical protein
MLAVSTRSFVAIRRAWQVGGRLCGYALKLISIIFNTLRLHLKQHTLASVFMHFYFLPAFMNQKCNLAVSCFYEFIPLTQPHHGSLDFFFLLLSVYQTITHPKCTISLLPSPILLHIMLSRHHLVFYDNTKFVSSK